MHVQGINIVTSSLAFLSSYLVKVRLTRDKKKRKDSILRPFIRLANSLDPRRGSILSIWREFLTFQPCPLRLFCLFSTEYLGRFVFSFFLNCTEMSTDTSYEQPQAAVMDSFQPYDQFILFGDSITQASHDQTHGFGFAPALQHGSSSIPSNLLPRCGL